MAKLKTNQLGGQRFLSPQLMLATGLPKPPPPQNNIKIALDAQLAQEENSIFEEEASIAQEHSVLDDSILDERKKLPFSYPLHKKHSINQTTDLTIARANDLNSRIFGQKHKSICS